MTFTSHRTLGATILVSHFTSAHTNIYSNHAEQSYLFCTSQLYYSKNRPLPKANCPLLPQSGMQTAGKFAVLTWLNACDTKMFLKPAGGGCDSRLNVSIDCFSRRK